MTDKQLLRNILINLISNAIKYSQATGIIEVGVCIDKNILIKVRDQGIGIPAEEQKHIFKRFFRSHNAAAIEGTGLGLNLVKRYVRLLNGTIEFASLLNCGTTFTVRLPKI
jgi:signal transduction histidine kinase